MSSALYTTGEYLALHPNWHVEDSPWKARQIESLLRRNRLQPQSITEVGCGAGAVLAELQAVLKYRCHLSGYEISPQAYELCTQRANDWLTFHLDNYLEHSLEHPDLILLIDVIEHIEDYMGFLKSLRGRSRHLLLHVPLDLSLQSLARGTPGKVRRSAGHLHYFTRTLFLQAMHDCGYNILDWMYTGAATERPASSIPMSLARWPRKLFFRLNPDFASLTLGGFSLMVLAQG